MRRTRAGITRLEATEELEAATGVATVLVADAPTVAHDASASGAAPVAAPRKRARSTRAKGTPSEAAAVAVVAEVAVAPKITTTTIARKRKRKTRAKAAHLEAPEIGECAVDGASFAIAEAPAIAITAMPAAAPVAVARKRKTPSRAKSTKLEVTTAIEPVVDVPNPASPDVAALAMAAPVTRDANNLADLIDSLRGRTAPVEHAETEDELPYAAIELFERCANEYRRESDKLVHRRRRIGTLVYPATPGQANAIGEFFVRALGLRIVDLDTRSLNGLPDEDVEARLATLSDPMAHVVALRRMGSDTDPRVFAAIESAHVDVLVLVFADPGATFGSSVQRNLKYRIDLQKLVPLEVVAGCFDDVRTTARTTDVPVTGAISAQSMVAARKGHTLVERFLRFLGLEARATGS
jgi:hypothetical protein